MLPILLEKISRKAETLSLVMHSLAVRDETLLGAQELAIEVTMFLRSLETQTT